MKKSLLLVFLALALVVSSCKKDDDNGTAPVTPATNAIVATWVSDGANVPFGLRMLLKVKKIVATFNSNNSYTVVQTDSSNKETTFTGTFTSTESQYSDTISTSATKGAKLFDIVANQSTPNAVTSTGIYAISGNSMTYEIIQTSPVLAGVSAPTAQGGFGSTTINGAKNPYYIQKYVKQQ
ncbi:MAG: hypothetical protein ACM3S2_04700 [Ignavibacteriales bacterium]